MAYYPCYNWHTGEVIGFFNPDAWASAALISDSNEHETSTISEYDLTSWHQHFDFNITTQQSTQKNCYKISDDLPKFNNHRSVKYSAAGTSNTADVVSRSELRESTAQLRKLFGFSETHGCGVDASSPPTTDVQDDKKDENWRDLLNCRYCRENGEEEVFYKSHALRDQRGHLLCPILMQHTCPQCLATGEKSHELSDCPLNQSMVTGTVTQTDPEPEQDQIKTPIEIETYKDNPSDANNIDNCLDRADFIAALKLRRKLNKMEKKSLVRCTYCRYHTKGLKMSRSHVLKDENGFVICPLLKIKVCPVCFATGPVAHTIRHCPLYNEWNSKP